MEVYLDNKKLEVSVKENNNVSALERFQDPEKLEGMQVTGRNPDTGRLKRFS